MIHRYLLNLFQKKMNTSFFSGLFSFCHILLPVNIFIVLVAASILSVMLYRWWMDGYFCLALPILCYTLSAFFMPLVLNKPYLMSSSSCPYPCFNLLLIPCSFIDLFTAFHFYREPLSFIIPVTDDWRIAEFYWLR